MRSDFVIPGYVLATLIVLSGCATTPAWHLDDIDRKLTPRTAVTEFANRKGEHVLWGGTIISSQNLKQGTQLEVLAFPLDRNHKPQSDERAYGRFIAEQPEYLETLDYSPGRMITLTGPLTEIRKGTIGETEYDYPVVTIEQSHLWSDRDPETRVRFGIGVIFSN